MSKTKLKTCVWEYVLEHLPEVDFGWELLPAEKNRGLSAPNMQKLKRKIPGRKTYDKSRAGGAPRGAGAKTAKSLKN